jgi:hypothetical protein
MNQPTTQLLAAVADGPCTADELSRRMSYEGLCDRDVCERIRFKETAKLQDVYYAKGDETKALRHYTRSNWREIESAIERGEFKTLPPKFAEYITEHITRLIDFAQGDIDALQDDISTIESKIESYETLQELM